MEVLLDQPELSQVPNKSQRLLQAKFDFFIMQLFTYLLCFKKVLYELHIFERKYIAKNFILKKICLPHSSEFRWLTAQIREQMSGTGIS